MQRNFIMLSRQKFIRYHLQCKQWGARLRHTWWWQHNSWHTRGDLVFYEITLGRPFKRYQSLDFDDELEVILHMLTCFLSLKQHSQFWIDTCKTAWILDEMKHLRNHPYCFTSLIPVTAHLLQLDSTWTCTYTCNYDLQEPQVWHLIQFGKEWISFF